jgi:hypothetical protein|tara:strand:+ start:67 stop:423 length:357 start_codon:yes stop_codon:yes gene_type:complete
VGLSAINRFVLAFGERREGIGALFGMKCFEGHDLFQVFAQAGSQRVELFIHGTRGQAGDELHHDDGQNGELLGVEGHREQHHETGPLPDRLIGDVALEFLVHAVAVPLLGVMGSIDNR